MGKLLEVFKKKGGMKLIKQYIQNGSFLTAVNQFLILGKSKTALELLELSASLKTKQKLEKMFRMKLDEFDKNYVEREHCSSNKIWICWFQGMDSAPELVKKCYQSVVNTYPDKDIVVLTSDNLNEYVTFPDYIIDKWKRGIITHTHMTDLLRLELLINYGGLWLDATVLCTDNAPAYFFDSDLFFYQLLKPGKNGNCIYMSSWLMSAKTNNKILMATRDLCYEYWKKYNSMLDYFLLHIFMSIVLERYEEDWNKIVPRDNAAPHILLLRLFEQYDETMWNTIKEQTPFHKLTYKFDNESKVKNNTYYDKIINE